MTRSGQAEAAVGKPVDHPEPATDANAAVRLADVLDRAEAAPLLASLIALRGRELAIDASGVRRIGGQCLQVLMSAAATWSDDAVPFSIGAASDDFIAGVGLFGVDPECLLPRETMNGAAA